MSSFIPGSDNGVTWRFKTLYARHLYFSRLEVMEELDPDHPELQKIRVESSDRYMTSSSTGSKASVHKRNTAHLSLKTVANTQSQSFENLSFDNRSLATSSATSDFPSTSGFPSTTGHGSHTGSNTIPLRTKRMEFEQLEAEVLPSA